MFAYRETQLSDELDDTTPLPELSLYDLLDTPTTTKEQHLNAADNDNDDDDVEEDDDDDECEDEEYLSSSMNESLNTPRPKKPPIVRILENKRLSGPAPIGSALKNMLGGPIRIVTTPTKPNQATDVKIIKKVQPQTFKSFANTPVKIGSTTIGTPTGAATSTSTAKNVAGVTMTQIKTADGKLLYLHKSMPVCSVSGAGQKVPLSTSTTTTRVVSQSPTSGGYIRQTILPKGVTITSGGLIKSAASGSPIAVRGLTIGQSKSITPTTTTTSPSSAAASTSVSTATATVTNKMPIKVVRTADGKLIKLNQGASPVLLNTKSAGVTVRAAGSTTASVTTAALGNSSTGNVVISKPTAQVIIKGPVKQLPAGASIRPVINNINSATVTATTGNINSNNASGSGNTLVGVTTSPSTATSTATATLTAGKMLVQSSTGKHIVVASKNIIKLSPKPSNSSSNSSIANTSTSATATPSGLHAIQLPGKSGVQYVRVLPTNATKVTTSPQKVPLGRPRTISGNSNNTNTTNSNNNSLTGSMDSTKKIVMRTTVALSGGSIVPLPTMQTLVPRRAPGATGTAKTVVGKSGNNNTSLEAARKHRLSELNVQIKQLTSDSSSSDIVGPEAKKARYVIAMPQTSTTSASSSSTTATTAVSQQQLQKMTSTRPATAAAGVQRVTVQGASGSGNVASSGNVTRKVYNLVTKGDAKGFKYMICNKGGEGKPRTVFNTTMRRGYTLADTKLRRPTTLTPQQVRFKQMKLQQQRQVLAQAQAKMRQQQHQQQQPHDKQQQQSPQSKQQQQQQTSAQANKASVPGKPLFDILKPPPTPTPAPAATTAIDALGGSRRKHCNCSKSQCLKLYCDCFANGEFCQDCTCKDCFNNLDYEVKRERAIRSCLERNPSAFKPKITAPNSGDMRLHNKGCNCKRSGCLKNYCECYEAKIPCSAMCKCVGCRNMEDRPDVDMDSMDSLIDVKLHASKMKELNGTVQPDNRSNVYLTDDVIEATIMCMLSRIVMHEKQGMQIEDTERVVMEELGESLNQIITFAKEKNDTIQTDDPKTTA